MVAPLLGQDHMDTLSPSEGVTGFQQILSSDGSCLDLDQSNGPTTATSTPLIKYSCNPGPTDNQLWKLDPVTYSGQTYYKAVTKMNLNRVFDVSDASTPLFSDVHLWDYLGNPNQLWKLAPISGTNYVQFQSANDLTKCLYTPSGMSSQYFIYTCSSIYTREQFYFKPERYGSDLIPGTTSNIIGYILPP
jgi:hypothetical protein